MAAIVSITLTLFVVTSLSADFLQVSQSMTDTGQTNF